MASRVASAQNTVASRCSGTVVPTLHEHYINRIDLARACVAGSVVIVSTQTIAKPGHGLAPRSGELKD